MTALYWLLFGGVLVLLPTAYAGMIGAPWVPSRKRAVERVFRDLEIQEDDVVVDLGAGDGKVLRAARARGARAIGYELSPIMYIAAKLATVGQKGITVHLKNFYNQPLPKETTVVFAFLVPDTMPRLKSYLREQGKSKLKFVVSYAFPFKDMEPLGVIREERSPAIYVYDAQAFVP